MPCKRYTEALADGGSAQEVSDRIQRRIASEVIELLDIVRDESPILEGGRAQRGEHISLGITALRAEA